MKSCLWSQRRWNYKVVTLILWVLPNSKRNFPNTVWRMEYQGNKYGVSKCNYGKNDTNLNTNTKILVYLWLTILITVSEGTACTLCPKFLLKTSLSRLVLLKFSVDMNSLRLKCRFKSSGWGLGLSISKQFPRGDPGTFLWVSLP